MKFSHKLMINNITKSDIDSLLKFLKKNSILTQSKKVEQFEKKWSQWLGVKYSVFVNSGSSANLISINIINEIFGSGEVIVPSLTWVSDVISVIKSNMKPVFVDINLKNLAMNEDEIEKKITNKTKCIFLTHAQGFNGLSNNLLKTIKKNKIVLVEDVCESHGATFNNKKLGTFGLISNFSFYYAHHLSTIEGGMICTNSKKIYQIARMYRAHGLLRESNDIKLINDISKKNKILNKEFIFNHMGYNMRNNELQAVIGINQLKRLDRNNNKRVRNFEIFLKYINKEKFFVDFDTKGSCNYAFNFLLKKQDFNLRNKLEKIMVTNKIEFRRGSAGGGNQLRQPIFKFLLKDINLKDFQNVEYVHNFGYYIGNYPDLSSKKIKKICAILNKI